MKILITPRSYGKTDKSVFELLEKNNTEYVTNPYGSILTKEQMIENVQDCDGIIVGVDPLDEDVLKSAPKLKVVSKYGVGVDNIDLDYCKAHDIKVTITKAANANAVSDFAFALLMACARKVTIINDMCHKKDWSKVMGLDVYGKTIGILGLGAIGKNVAKRASGFSMKIKAYDVYFDEEFLKQYNIEKSSIEDILKTCDFISLHLPLTTETNGIINKDAFAIMKKNAVIINTARGALINENDLIDALKNNRIAAAGIDVFNEEPPTNEELYKLDNLIMGSHASASTPGSSETMSLMATQNIIDNLI